MNLNHAIDTDVLVIGGGAAGIRAAKQLLLRAISLLKLWRVRSWRVVRVVELEKELKSLMGECAGAVRHGKKIEEGKHRLKTLKDWVSGIRSSAPLDYWRLFSYESKLKVSEMILQSALKREESRGAHFREDYASQDDPLWRVNICVFQDDDEEMRLSLEPVS